MGRPKGEKNKNYTIETKLNVVRLYLDYHLK